MVTYAQVRYTDLGDYVSVVRVWSIREEDVCVILVGDFTSYAKPRRVMALVY